MEITEFVSKVKKAVMEKLGEEYWIDVREVRKNNGVILQGLLIHSEKRNVSPTIYLNSFWEAYERGLPFAVIVKRILQIFEEDTPEENVDMSFFKSFEKVKSRICYKLISAERNQDLLQTIPHKKFLDLAICYYYAYQGEILGNGAILIHNSHMEMWNTTREELFKLAQNNTPRLFPNEEKNMEYVVKELLEEQAGAEGETLLDEIEQRQLLEQLPMLILSNDCRVHGAACILYPGLLSQLADKIGKDLYIIPSSIHEVILLPDDGVEDKWRLKDMIAEVNSTQVEPEEILSNHLYCFSRLTGRVNIV